MPPINDTTLSQTHSPVKFSIHTSTQISRRTSAVLSNLQQPSSENNNKPPIIILTAKANATNKLVSIVEIAKRELAARNLKCFQYNALSSEVVEVPRRKGKGGEGDGGSESEEAFEVMGERELGEMKKRSVPVLTVYLARESVRELKAAYG